MKNRLELLEARIQALIEEGAARLFLFGENQNDLGSRLVAEMKANLHAQADGSFWAPNLYYLVLNPDQEQALQNDSTRLDELVSVLQNVAGQTDLRFASPPVVKTMADPALRAGEVRVLAKFNLDQLLDTSVIDIEQITAQDEPNSGIKPDAYLIVDGGKVFPLDKPVLNIGRGPANDLILDDLKVSRSHAQMRLVSGHYVIFDLNSTGGTFVNDQRVSQSALFPGDVISLAGIPLIFGQEPARSGETQEYVPPGGSDLSPDQPIKPGEGS